MNERINELAIQAGGVWRGGYVEQANGDSVYTDKKFVDGADMDVEQFAKLLVKECADAIAKDSRLNDVRSAANGCVMVLKEHFGVE